MTFEGATHAHAINMEMLVQSSLPEDVLKLKPQELDDVLNDLDAEIRHDVMEIERRKLIKGSDSHEIHLHELRVHKKKAHMRALLSYFHRLVRKEGS